MATELIGSNRFVDDGNDAGWLVGWFGCFP